MREPLCIKQNVNATYRENGKTKTAPRKRCLEQCEKCKKIEEGGDGSKGK